MSHMTIASQTFKPHEKRPVEHEKRPIYMKTDVSQCHIWQSYHISQFPHKPVAFVTQIRTFSMPIRKETYARTQRDPRNMKRGVMNIHIFIKPMNMRYVLYSMNIYYIFYEYTQIFIWICGYSYKYTDIHNAWCMNMRIFIWICGYSYEYADIHNASFICSWICGYS